MFECVLVGSLLGDGWLEKQKKMLGLDLNKVKSEQNSFFIYMSTFTLFVLLLLN